MSKNTKLQELIDKNPKLNMSELGRVLDITPQAARQMLLLSDLNGHYDRLVKIADYVGCEVEELFGPTSK